MQPWQRVVHSKEQSEGLFGQWFGTLLFAGFSFVLFYVFAIQPPRSLPGALISGFFAVLGLASLVHLGWRTLERWKFGDMRITLEGTAPMLGGEVQAVVRLPSAAARALKLTAEVECTEVTYGTDSKGRSARKEVRLWYHEAQFPVRVGRAQIRLPVADAPVIARGTAYDWALKVRVELPGVDLSRTFPLEVAQPPADAPEKGIPSTPLPTTRQEIEAPAPEQSAAPGWALVAANLVPLGGVAFLGWRIADVVFLYWVENLVIGWMNVLRIATAQPEKLVRPRVAGTGLRPWELGVAKAFLAGFFIVHYGGFCAAHGAVLADFFPARDASGQDLPAEVRVADLLADPWLLAAIAALFASHLVSYLRNYLYRGEYRRVNVALLMMRPYGRIFVTHLFIFAGALALEGLESPLAAMVAFVAIKTAIDFHMHRRERMLLAA
jgi:hypothetical protein